MIEAIIMGGVLISFFALGYLSGISSSVERVKELKTLKARGLDNESYIIELIRSYKEQLKVNKVLGEALNEALKEQKNG